MIAEILLGEPIFPGDSSVDQIVEIIKVLGTPTPEDIKLMKGNGTQFKFPNVNRHQWSKVKPLSFFVKNLLKIKN